MSPRCWTSVAVASMFFSTGASGQALPRVRIDTELGAIEIEIDTARAPATGANFLRYLEVGLYRGGAFHRTVTLANQPDNPIKIEVIQASADTARRNEYFPPIALERTTATGVKHLAGAISMARTGPDTARDQFFICLTDQPELDFGGKRNPDGQGFAAFGRVVSGMATVRAIQARPADGQRLTPTVGITEAKRVAAR